MEALAELTRTNSDGSTALHVAAWSGQLQMSLGRRDGWKVSGKRTTTLRGDFGLNQAMWIRMAPEKGLLLFKLPCIAQSDIVLPFVVIGVWTRWQIKGQKRIGMGYCTMDCS